jgi:hypothetical protein
VNNLSEKASFRQATPTSLPPRPKRVSSSQYGVRHYATRFDSLRVRENIDIHTWARESKTTLKEMLGWRKGRDIRTDKLARVVEAARRITASAIRAADLVDLGEETVIPSAPPNSFRREPGKGGRVIFGTPADDLLHCEGISTEYLASQSGITRPTIVKVRRRRPVRASVIRKLVVALTTMLCRRVYAGEICDIDLDCYTRQ